jgi:hypothetical protein
MQQCPQNKKKQKTKTNKNTNRSHVHRALRCINKLGRLLSLHWRTSKRAALERLITALVPATEERRAIHIELKWLMAPTAIALSCAAGIERATGRTRGVSTTPTAARAGR